MAQLLPELLSALFKKCNFPSFKGRPELRNAKTHLKALADAFRGTAVTADAPPTAPKKRRSSGGHCGPPSHDELLWTAVDDIILKMSKETEHAAVYLLHLDRYFLILYD
jgi:hypothetical protein